MSIVSVAPEHVGLVAKGVAETTVVVRSPACHEPRVAQVTGPKVVVVCAAAGCALRSRPPTIGITNHPYPTTLARHGKLQQKFGFLE